MLPLEAGGGWSSGRVQPQLWASRLLGPKPFPGETRQDKGEGSPEREPHRTSDLVQSTGGGGGMVRVCQRKEELLTTTGTGKVDWGAKRMIKARFPLEESGCDGWEGGESSTRMACPVTPSSVSAPTVWMVGPWRAGAGVTRLGPAAQRWEKWLHGGCGPIVDTEDPELPP